MNDERTEQVAPGDRASALTLLVFLEDEVRSLRLPEDGVVVVGRGDEAAFQVFDRSVSRLHAAIHVRTSDGETQVELVDHGSSNGTRVGGVALVPHTPRRVRLGDMIELGSVGAVLQYSPLASRPADPGASRARAPRGGPRRGPPPEAPVLVSPRMQDLYRVAARVAASPLGVLVLGETGVGKEALAEHLHARSSRADRPLVKLNCAALPEALLESELFGYVRGAFTGADQDKCGVLEAADGGTVLLDEVGELPLGTQAKILRVVERGELMRIGSLRARQVDVRFVAATNRDLPSEALAGRFRLDLYHRLNGVTLTIPPLRERVDELPELARYFAAAHRARVGDAIGAARFSPRALEAMARYPWPGNVRELKHAVERALVLAGDGPIEVEHLGLANVGRAVPEPAPRARAIEAAREASADLPEEALRIREALERSGGNQARAAKLLGMARGTLAIRMDKYGIGRPRK